MFMFYTRYRNVQKLTNKAFKRDSEDFCTFCGFIFYTEFSLLRTLKKFLLLLMCVI